MRYKGLVEPLRAARRRKGLSQSALGDRTGVSRVTIARLESGSARDVRAGTLVRLCDGLGLELCARPAGTADAEKLLERERALRRRLGRRLAHARLAARLLASPRHGGRAAVARARSEVDRWERNGLCSSHYISRWRRILAGAVGRVASRLLDPGDWGDALFQNSPFALELGVP